MAVKSRWLVIKYVLFALALVEKADVHLNDKDKTALTLGKKGRLNAYSVEEAQKIAVNSQGKKLAITGYPFWDSAHWSKADQKKGHNHGSAQVATLWELHPAWKVELK